MLCSGPCVPHRLGREPMDRKLRSLSYSREYLLFSLLEWAWSLLRISHSSLQVFQGSRCKFGDDVCHRSAVFEVHHYGGSESWRFVLVESFNESQPDCAARSGYKAIVGEQCRVVEYHIYYLFLKSCHLFRIVHDEFFLLVD